MAKRGTTKRHPRVDATDARDFAGKVHSEDKPVLFRTYDTRAEANSRCWEWNTGRPVFNGLGVEFVVLQIDAGNRESGFGVYGRPAKTCDEVIVPSSEHGPLLKLIRNYTPPKSNEDKK